MSYDVSMLVSTSIVVPVYRTTTTLVALVERIDAVFSGVEHEIVLVDDGSPSDTWSVVRRLAEAHPHVRGIQLGRNVGQHGALVAGVRAAGLPIVVTIDDDLQNPPEEIPTLLAALSDDVDVVYGVAAKRHHKMWRNLTSRATRVVIARALGAQSARQMSNFRAFRTDLREAFAGDLGPNVSLDAVLAWGTRRFSSVEVEHAERAEGRSNYSARSLVRYALDVVTGYSSIPLQVASGIGLIAALFGVLVLGWVVGRALVQGNEVPGFPFLASTIAIFAGAQLVAIGVIGEYLARMHFRLMRKPTFVIRTDTKLPDRSGGSRGDSCERPVSSDRS